MFVRHDWIHHLTSECHNRGMSMLAVIFLVSTHQFPTIKWLWVKYYLVRCWINRNFSLGKYRNYLPCLSLFRKTFCFPCKWTIISNFLQAENSYFIENIVFPFSLTLYLPKEKKSDKRKEKEVSITFVFYFSLQIKNT